MSGRTLPNFISKLVLIIHGSTNITFISNCSNSWAIDSEKPSKANFEHTQTEVRGNPQEVKHPGYGMKLTIAYFMYLESSISICLPEAW